MKEIKSIVDLQLKQVEKLVAGRNITLLFSEELKEWIAKIGYDPTLGARPLKRVVQKYITNGLSQKILEGSVAEGDTVEVTVGDRGTVEFVTQVKAEVV